MNKTLLVVLILACLQTPNSAVAQSTAAKTEPAQTRAVQGQLLTSTFLPSIRIKFEDNFKYIGSQKFILYERAQVEQFFFVDADSERRIKRLYFVQFEGYLPNVDATYNYPVTETVMLAGQTYIVNAESVPNISEALKPNPESDAARAASLLESKGYHLGPSIKFQRFVRLVDDAKRNEIILVYIEDAGASAAEKPDKEFSARALKGFTVLK